MESKRPPPSPLVDSYVVSVPAPSTFSPPTTLRVLRLHSSPRRRCHAQVPGDIVLDLSEMTNQTIKIGAGLRQVKLLHG
jgi:exosome complex component RRP40